MPVPKLHPPSCLFKLRPMAGSNNACPQAAFRPSLPTSNNACPQAARHLQAKANQRGLMPILGQASRNDSSSCAIQGTQRARRPSRLTRFLALRDSLGPSRRSLTTPEAATVPRQSRLTDKNFQRVVRHRNRIAIDDGSVEIRIDILG